MTNKEIIRFFKENQTNPNFKSRKLKLNKDITVYIENYGRGKNIFYIFSRSRVAKIECTDRKLEDLGLLLNDHVFNDKNSYE